MSARGPLPVSAVRPPPALLSRGPEAEGHAVAHVS